jgi:tetratricopeptide (TPR) repeat protein
MRAQVNMHAGKLDQAINDFSEILKNDPDFTPALIGRSAVWNQKGEIEKSQDDLDAAIQSAPEYAEESDYSRLLQIAQLAFVQEKYEEAMTAANEAIEISQQEPLQAIRIRAGVYCYLDQFAEALDDYNRLIEAAESREPGLLNGRGQTYCELGEFDLALADLQEAVELARKTELNTLLAYTLNGLGKTLVGLGRYDEAQEAFDESFSLQPKNSWLQFNQGLMAAVRNQPLKAIVFFQKALELHDPVLSPKKKAKAKAFVERHSGKSSEDMSET